jgi:hypothetical protein
MFQKMERESSKGFTLHDFGNGWGIQWSKGIYHGSLQEVIKYCVIELDIPFKELEYGVMVMEREFHNAAEYGIFKSFMWSYDRKEPASA